MKLILPDRLTYDHTYRNINKIGLHMYAATEDPGRQVNIITRPNDDHDLSRKISQEEGGIYLLTCLNKFIHKNERGHYIRCYVYGNYLPLDIWIKKHEHVVDENKSFTIHFLQILR